MTVQPFKKEPYSFEHKGFNEKEIKEAIRKDPMNITIKSVTSFFYNDAALPFVPSDPVLHKEGLAALFKPAPSALHFASTLSKIKDWFELRDCATLVKESVGNSKNLSETLLKNRRIILLASILLKEREIALKAFLYSQFLRLGNELRALVPRIQNYDTRKASLCHFNLTVPGIESLRIKNEPTTSDAFRFALWIEEVIGECGHIDFSSPDMVECFDFIEQISKSSCEEVAEMASNFLRWAHLFQYTKRSNRYLDKYDDTVKELDELIGKENIRQEVFKLAPFVALNANIVCQRNEALDITEATELKWPPSSELFYSLRERVIHKFGERFRQMVELSVESSYFSKRQVHVASELKKLYVGTISLENNKIFDQLMQDDYAIRSAPLDIEQFSSSSSSSSQPQQKKKAAAKRVEEPKADNDNNNVSAIPAVAIPKISPMQERLAHLSHYRPKLDNRVSRWFGINKDNIQKVREFKDRGLFTYANCTDEELSKAVLGHQVPRIDSVILDPDFKKRYTFKTNNGYGIVAQLASGGMVLNGTLHIGLDGDRVIHRFFHEARPGNLSFNLLVRALPQEPQCDKDPFECSLSDNDWFTNNQLFHIEGQAAAERITVTDSLRNISITAIPLPKRLQNI